MRLQEWYTLHSQIVSKFVLFNLFCQTLRKKIGPINFLEILQNFFPTYLCTKPNRAVNFPLIYFPHTKHG